MSERPIPPLRKDPEYQRVWRAVDGSLRRAINAHPECFARGPSLRSCRESIIKRLTGDIMSLLSERSGPQTQGEEERGVSPPPPHPEA